MKKHWKSNVLSIKNKRISGESLKQILSNKITNLFHAMGGDRNLRISQMTELYIGEGMRTAFAMICHGIQNSEETNSI